jgi:hypothetical protein
LEPNTNSSLSIHSINNLLEEIWDEGLFAERSGGTGILFRDQKDGMKYIENVQEVLPASFLHNSIEAPNTGYNLNSKTTKIEKKLDDSGELVPSVGTITTDDICPNKKRKNDFFIFDPKRDPNDINGVFYAHDSNSCDHRAIFTQSSFPPNNYFWDGNGFYEDNDGQCNRIVDSSKLGSGAYGAGSPYAGWPGGGTGYHCPWNGDIVRGFGDGSNNPNLKQELNWSRAFYNDNKDPLYGNPCLINYVGYQIDYTKIDSINQWKEYLDDFMNQFRLEKNNEPISYLANSNGSPKPCLGNILGWVDNIRAMISLQNALWRFCSDWTKDAYSWWGWNEIPMPAKAINDPENFGAYAIIMPLNLDNPKYEFKYLKSRQLDFIKEKLEGHRDIKFHYKHVVILHQVPKSGNKFYLECTDILNYKDIMKMQSL